MILIEKVEGDNYTVCTLLIKKKKKLSRGLNHGQFGPSNAVVITAIIKYCLTSL